MTAWQIAGTTLLAAIFAVLLIWVGREARGHEWYDADCCSETDCREALPTEIEAVENGILIAPTGEVLDRLSTKVRPSHDGLWHICKSGGAYLIDGSPNLKGGTLCVYEPLAF